MKRFCRFLVIYGAVSVVMACIFHLIGKDRVCYADPYGPDD